MKPILRLPFDPVLRSLDIRFFLSNMGQEQQGLLQRKSLRMCK